MINVQIDEDDLLGLLVDRLEYWTTDTDILNLYESYLKDLVYGGCFENVNLDIRVLIDNLYINDTNIMDKEELKSNDIDIDDSEKVLAKDIDNDLYLVTTY